ncbi:MAG: KH domain-containing protein [Polyangiales bacterium]
MSPESLIEHLARSLVDREHEVSVTSREDGGVHVIELRVAREDLGRVIGRSGQTARALRTVLHAAAHGQRRCVLNILED